MPDALPFPDSFRCHQYVGLCGDQQKATRDGPLLVKDGFCSCSSCRPPLYDFYNCKLKSQNGKFRRVECKLAKGQVAGVPQLLALEEWAASLEKGQVVAVRVDESEAGKYNGQTYYLALVLGLAFELPESMVHATQGYEEGWLVVEAQWYDLIQVSHRGYKLLPGKVLILVNSMIKLPGVCFERTVGRAVAEKKHLLGELKHNEIEACC